MIFIPDVLYILISIIQMEYRSIKTIETVASCGDHRRRSETGGEVMRGEARIPKSRFTDQGGRLPRERDIRYGSSKV